MRTNPLTRWGRMVDPDRPWPEYPRPQLVREEWVNLNGRWEHAFTAVADGDAPPEEYDGEIVVPFSPETTLSGVGRQLQPDEWLWYRRRGITAPVPPTGGRVLLHFGAVDQSCTVWLNGVEVARHTGGYLPFTCDVTDHLRGGGGETLEVRVRDLSETAPHARGKQRLDAGGIWYTAQSGIWQTVWMEPVPAVHVTGLRLVPDLDAGVLEVTVEASAPAPVQVEVAARRVRGSAGEPLRVPIDDVRVWTPQDPHLYDVEVVLGDPDGPDADRVSSYAGMRSVTVRDGRVLLNGDPVLQVGVLDQGYWPDGLLTPPDDAAMVHDITAMKDLGFSMLRKHIKVEPLRWYHHCDRLGMLVWQDMVNGGGRYRHLVTTLPATRPVRLRDSRYALFHREDEAGRAEFREEVRATVALLRNVTALVVWVPFNEGWGQFDAADVADEVAALDPSRLVNHVSGWIDQGGGHLRSFHSYGRRFRLPRRRRGDRRPDVLSEYGGLTLSLDGHAGHDVLDTVHGYRRFADPASLADGFARLHDTDISRAVQGGLQATVYTQLSDVETELNGLLTWDREVGKIDGDVVRATLARLRDVTPG